MPDFDPKTIPTLDDVIERVIPVVSDIENSADEAEPIIAEESESVLFSAEPVIDFTDGTNIEDTELEPEASFDLVEEDEEAEPNQTDTLPELADEEDSENFESALIDYNTEEPAPTTDTEETESISDEFEIDEQPTTAVHSPALISDSDLQSISDDIVLQLMPELEQRLRVLVQQVLKEKLPAEIIQFEATSSTDIDD